MRPTPPTPDPPLLSSPRPSSPSLRAEDRFPRSIPHAHCQNLPPRPSAYSPTPAHPRQPVRFRSYGCGSAAWRMTEPAEPRDAAELPAPGSQRPSCVCPASPRRDMLCTTLRASTPSPCSRSRSPSGPHTRSPSCLSPTQAAHPALAATGPPAGLIDSALRSAGTSTTATPRTSMPSLRRVR